MDTSFWIRCNPKITVDHTAKKFFGQYLYKLVVYAPAGRLIHSKGVLSDELQHRKTLTRNINIGYWGYRNNKEIDNANVEFLELLRNAKQTQTSGIKFRVEEPRIQIYADNETELINLVNNNFSNYQNYIESVTGPVDAEAETILNSGAILKRTDPGYKYKVIIRDGRYSTDIKNSVLQYLINCGPEMIKIPNGTSSMFSKPMGYVWNCYFYTNDLSMLTFVNLMAPGIISNYHELIVKTNK